ncbi:MAG: preprotein translocase subunit SecE [Terriglobales bacterium]
MAKSDAAQLLEDNKVVETIRSWPERVRGFYRDVRAELKKVSTPSLKEVRATTTVVIIAVFLFGLFFFLVDWVLSRSVDQLFRVFQ